MQVGDLPLVFELSGIHTPPKGGGERYWREVIHQHHQECNPDRMPMGSRGFPQDCPRGRTSGRHLQVPPEPLPNRMADRRREKKGHPPQGRKGDR